MIHHSLPVTAVTPIHSHLERDTQQILTVARRVHRLLGGGWSDAIYCDALVFLCEERHITCRRAAGVRGVGPVRSAIVCGEATLVRVCSHLEEETRLRDGLAATGLEQAVLLRFDDDGVASRIMSAHDCVATAATGTALGHTE